MPSIFLTPQPTDVVDGGSQLLGFPREEHGREPSARPFVLSVLGPVVASESVLTRLLLA